MKYGFGIKIIPSQKLAFLEYVFYDSHGEEIPASTAHTIQRFLIQTVEEGSGRHAKPEGGTAAGKTATAQTGWYDGEREILHTWFAGYFPAEEPEYAIVVLKEDGSSGATDGAPVFKEIAQGINQMKAQER